MKSFTSYFVEAKALEEQTELLEKLIVFGGGAKYGQIVFMSGGAGSGKGFASSAFMESEKFKIRDVDEWKKAFLHIANLKKKYPEIQGLDLRNEDDVFALHMFVKKLKVKDNTLENLFADLKSDRLPNIIFDITGKEMEDFDEVIPRLLDVGYDSKNINVAWILADYKVAYVANLTRDRIVPADVFLGTHEGAANTMQKLLDAKKMPRGANGRFVVVLNNRENTIFFKPGTLDKKGRLIPPPGIQKWGPNKGKEAARVADFYYITVKDAGKPFRPEERWKEELHLEIVKNIPGGEATIADLKAHAVAELKAQMDKAQSKYDADKSDKNKDSFEKAKAGHDYAVNSIEADKKIEVRARELAAKALKLKNDPTGKSIGDSVIAKYKPAAKKQLKDEKAI